jgi:hypothetical protein
MKTKWTIFFFIILLAISFQSKSQSYIKLVNDSLYWDVAYAEEGYICEGFGDITPRRYFFDGDSTIINGIVYQQMKAYPFIELDGEYPNCGPFAIDTIAYLDYRTIREDTINHKVYRYDAWSDSEVLLFDFTLNQGDTFHVEGAEWDIIVDTVYQYTTEDGIERKMIEFNDIANYWGFMLEGIGGPLGPFREAIELPLATSGEYLYCVQSKNGNSVLYGPCDDFITGIENPTEFTCYIDVYPNPFKDYIRVESNQKFHKILIRDLSGLVVKAIEVNENIAFIETKDLVASMYFLEVVIDNKQSYQRKLIKINSL